MIYSISKNSKTIFSESLIRRYDCTGPRYTSYPTALQFNDNVSNKDYVEWVTASNDELIPASLSLYFHVPFCNTICYYCGCSKIVTKNPSHAGRYIDLLKKEIQLQAGLFDTDRSVEQMHWGGGTPTFLSDDQLDDIIRTVRQHFSIKQNDDGEFSIEVDPRTVTPERIQRLRSMGLNRISYGIQDFNPDVQKAINRIQDTDHIVTVINSARANGFKSVNLDLMYGLPRQTSDSFDQTLEQTIQCQPDRIAVYNYAHLPDMFKPQRRINPDELPDAMEKLEILQLTIEKLQNAGYVYIGMDHFAKANDELVIAQQNGSLHRNFQGYSTHANCDTVAMGITAISSIGNNYSQNMRKIEDYEKALNENRVPVFRGFELEADDVLRREVINNLLCNMTLDITALENKWKFSFSDYFSDSLSRLIMMAEDGLIDMDDNHISITSQGRLLARTICMEFDAYLQQDKQSQRYSKVI